MIDHDNGFWHGRGVVTQDSTCVEGVWADEGTCLIHSINKNREMSGVLPTIEGVPAQVMDGDGGAVVCDMGDFSEK